MGREMNFITGALIAGTICGGAYEIVDKITEQTIEVHALNGHLASLETTLRETLKERSTFTGTPEEKQIDGKAYMCVPLEEYGR